MREYQCNWKGYGIMEEWIPKKNLRNTPELLQEWKEKLKFTGGNK